MSFGTLPDDACKRSDNTCKASLPPAPAASDGLQATQRNRLKVSLYQQSFPPVSLRVQYPVFASAKARFLFTQMNVVRFCLFQTFQVLFFHSKPVYYYYTPLGNPSFITICVSSCKTVFYDKKVCVSCFEKNVHFKTNCA
jgi:hypothetical protein